MLPCERLKTPGPANQGATQTLRYVELELAGETAASTQALKRIFLVCPRASPAVELPLVIRSLHQVFCMQNDWVVICCDKDNVMRLTLELFVAGFQWLFATWLPHRQRNRTGTGLPRSSPATLHPAETRWRKSPAAFLTLSSMRPCWRLPFPQLSMSQLWCIQRRAPVLLPLSCVRRQWLGQAWQSTRLKTAFGKYAETCDQSAGG